MEYINVSQFYETVFCFAIPLLLIQRLILYCGGLSEKYEQYRRNYYEAEFAVTKQYEFVPQQKKDVDQANEQANKPPKQQGIRDSMLSGQKQERRNSQGQIINDSQVRKSFQEQNRMSDSKSSSRYSQKSRYSSPVKNNYPQLDLETDKQFKVDPRLSQRQKRKSVKADESKQKKSEVQLGEIQKKETDQNNAEKKEKEDVNKDKQQKNQQQKKQEQKQQQTKQKKEEQESKEEIQQEKQRKLQNTSIQQKQQQTQGNKKQIQSQIKSNSEDAKSNNSRIKSEEQLPNPRISKQQELQENTGQRQKVEQIQMDQHRETELDRDNLAIQNPQQPELKPEQQIQISPYQMQQKQMNDRRKIKYCRRIDEAFNFFTPIIYSVIVLGIITRSVYIFSMCCFFGFAFTSLLFNYGQLLQRLEDSTAKQSMFGKINKLLAGIFIFALFISYWIDNEFNYD